MTSANRSDSSLQTMHQASSSGMLYGLSCYSVEQPGELPGQLASMEMAEAIRTRGAPTQIPAGIRGYQLAEHVYDSRHIARRHRKTCPFRAEQPCDFTLRRDR